MAKGKIKLGLAQPLYRNEEAIKMMLYQITPVLTNWAHAQKEAQRQSNPKNAGLYRWVTCKQLPRFK